MAWCGSTRRVVPIALAVYLFLFGNATAAAPDGTTPQAVMSPGSPTTDTVAGGSVAEGKGHYALCVTCHGVNGEGNQGINGPRLAGMDPWYLTRQLNNFKQGVRGTGRGDVYGAQMKPMADALPDSTAVADVAAYIATLQVAPALPTVRADARRGRTLYASCAACHGATAQGLPPLDAPRLAGASDWYLVTQLRNFRSGARGGNAADKFGQQMVPVAKLLSDTKAIADVVGYINTMTPQR